MSPNDERRISALLGFTDPVNEHMYLRLQEYL